MKSEKFFTKKEIIPIGLIILIFILSFYLYPKLPEKVPSHWNIKGEIDAWSGRDFAVFFYPALILLVYIFMTFLPLIDPLRKNYIRFSKLYFLFRTFFVAFFAGLYFYTIWASLGRPIGINYFIVPLISFLFIFIGLFLPKVKKNYFIGIRTPLLLKNKVIGKSTLF